ncbi:hypothetical protein HAPAU_40840 [Halalkalicoccus paucihalophilus]|uniref:Uncharacterized protein n=1 Tax=Halalkalicoccus paucihalophilus TaxID=1008153 RepID=A0A151A8P0_9EURY|nr:hypothetical protein [Halalkalicoccus paucihalophilus]KYH24005.1 hypothetical protein HAPAU_40840 [Halalkalicoccus paucihalophilus]
MLNQLEKEMIIIERHIDILSRVIENEPIGIVKLSNEGGYKNHKVRYSLRILEKSELIEPSPQGATVTEHTAEFVEYLDERLETIADKLDTMKLENYIENNH